MTEDRFMLESGKPSLAPSKVNPRDYQLAAIDAARNEFKAGRRSTVIILPTGAGKTIVFGLIIRRVIEKGGRGLVLAHRNELISQAVQKLELCGVTASVEKADQFARALYDPDAVVATVQTMQGDRLASWPSDHFKLMVTDEVHHSTADTYRTVYKQFTPHALHLGVTATIDRADKAEVIGDVFESVAYELSFWDAVNMGILAKPLILQLSTDPVIDLRSVRKTGGDYSLDDLAERIGPMIEVLANAIRQVLEGRKVLVFCCDVASSMGMASALTSVGIMAEYTYGEDKDRAEKLRRFDNGEYQALCNCNLLTEGYDGKNIEAIALCRPTMSRALCSQMIGRGTRPDTENCLVIDFEYLTEQHDLGPVRAWELFDSTGTDSETLAIMSDMASRHKNEKLDLMDIRDRAEKVHQERQVLRIQAQEREIRFTKRKMFYPDQVCDTLGIARRGPKNVDPANRASDRQLEFLAKLGVQDPDGTLSKKRASKMIDVIKTRLSVKPTDPGSSTVKQVGHLISYGISPEVARGMSRVDASAFLELKWGKRPFTPRRPV